MNHVARVMRLCLKSEACPWRCSLRIGASGTLAFVLSVGPSSTDKAVAHHDTGCEPVPVEGKYDPAAAPSHQSIDQFWVFEPGVYHTAAWYTISRYGADSIDGSSASRYAVTLPLLDRASRQMDMLCPTR
jgi:hypothetical protein